MPLLNRIAISNGDKNRKAAANKVLAAMNHQKIANWHQSMRVEIRRKQARRCSPSHSNIMLSK